MYEKEAVTLIQSARKYVLHSLRTLFYSSFFIPQQLMFLILILNVTIHYLEANITLSFKGSIPLLRFIDIKSLFPFLQKISLFRQHHVLISLFLVECSYGKTV